MRSMSDRFHEATRHWSVLPEYEDFYAYTFSATTASIKETHPYALYIIQPIYCY
jgi:hypothetical protein